MSLTIEPKKGIRLKLDQYAPIRSWQGGGKFWEHDFQLTIRQGRLANFLPRAIEEGGSVLFEQMIDGGEALSESVPLSSAEAAPASEIAGLRAALAELKAKSDDPQCDPTKREIIEAFRLPDPAKDAELYRLYGRGSNRRLLVLWGTEKEAGSALVPLQAVGRVPQRVPIPARAASTGNLTWLWLLLAALLLAVAVGGWYFWKKSQHPTFIAATATPTPAGSASPTATPADTPLAAATASPLPAAGMPTPTPAESPRKSSPSNPGTSNAAAAAVAAASPTPTDGEIISPGVTPIPIPTPAHRASPRPSRSDELYSAPPGTTVDQDDVAPKPSRPRVTPTPTPRGTPRIGPPVASTPIPADVGGPQATPSTANPLGGANKEFLPGDGSLSAGPTPTVAPTPAPSATPTPASAASPSAAPGGTPVLSGSPAKTVALPAVDITSSRSDNPPKNGHVDLVLKARAHDDTGADADLPRITEWRVDKVVQKGKDGKPLTGPELPVTLTKGVHRVSLSGAMPDGRAVNTEADVNVNVKVTEEGSVDVQPVHH